MVLSMDRWFGQVAVVTGASSGIGAVIAERLVENGLLVVALARRKDKLDQLAKKFVDKKGCFSKKKKNSDKRGKFFPIQADLTKEEDILNAFKWIKDNNLGPVHILINNAGAGSKGLLTDGDSELWEKVVQLNVIGLSIATREAVQDMKANNVDGHIIHINSIGGHRVPNISGVNIYPASKYAVTALAETLRLELNSQKSKIKITSLSPGLVDTELLPPEVKQLRKKLYEENKILEAEQIADAVVYVLSTPPHVQIQELTISPISDFI